MQASDFELLWVALAIGGVILGIVWAIFPFLLLSRLDKMNKQLQEMDQKLFVIATNSNQEAQRG